MKKLYVLELEGPEGEHPQWYVGLTDDPERRKQQHMKGNGSPWTSDRTVLSLEVLGEYEMPRAKELENQITAVLSRVYGPVNARGGDYTTPEGMPRYRPDRIPGELLANLNELVEKDIYQVPLTDRDLERMEEESDSIPPVTRANLQSRTEEGYLDRREGWSPSQTVDRVPMTKFDLPFRFHRDKASDERPKVHALEVTQATEDYAYNVERQFDGRFKKDLYRTDLREAIYLAGMMNLEDVDGVLREWGYGRK